MIYVISNVEYPEGRKLTPDADDLLVFLNKARSEAYYRGHPRRMCIRRSPKPEYGADIPDADNRFIFSGPSEKTAPAAVIDELKRSYDWDYEIERGKAKCPTTGYMAVKWLEKLYPEEQITLVNFGHEVKRSSYRCPWHNWRFEDKALSAYKHIFTADTAEHDRIEIAYCCGAGDLETMKTSAESVLRHNPNAHVTVASAEPLAVPDGFDNVVFDMAQHYLRPAENREAAYLRLFLPDALPRTMKKVVCLDCHTLCRSSLNELWRKDVEYIGACHSHDFGRMQAGEIGIETYHLDAVLLMNLDALRELKFSTIAAFAAGHFAMPRTRFLGVETVLNTCFGDLVETLPTKWCYCMNRRYRTYGEEDVNNNTAAVLCYIGGQTEAMRRDAAKGL